MENELIPIKKITVKVNVDFIIEKALEGMEEVESNDVRGNINDTLIVDRLAETIEYYHNIFAGNQIFVKYHLEDYIESLLKNLDARTLFLEKGTAPEDAVFEEGITSTYELTVEAEGLEPRIVTGRYCMEELPKDYAKFIHLIGKAFTDFETWGGYFQSFPVCKTYKKEIGFDILHGYIR